MTVEALGVELLYRKCDPAQFDFETTAEVEDLDEIIGQERAVGAIDFGIGIRREGFNLFALGPNGTGRTTAVRQLLQKKTVGEPIPADWCYVNNFKQSHRPIALRLPAGRANELAEEMKRLVEELKAVIPAAFESDEYHSRQQSLEEEFKEKQESALEELQTKARERNIALIRTPAGLAFAPIRDGEVVSPEQFMELPDEERRRVQSEIESLQSELQRLLRQAPQWMRETRRKLKELNEEVARYAVAPLIEELKEKVANGPDGETLSDVVEYLDNVQADIIENVEKFLDSGEEAGAASPAQAAQIELMREAFFSRYQVNVLVNHSETEGAPVIYEDNPTYQNLIGRVEHMAQMGTLVTDFTQIKAGALHRANGGYLILDARKVLMQPFAWEGLKRALRAQEICIESLGQMYSFISTVSLEPEPLPLKMKVVLLGERLLYYMLHQLDPDFSELFKVAADFEDQMEWNGDNSRLYARLIGTLARKEELVHFDRDAVARVVEHSARLVGDTQKLSTQMQSVVDLLRETDYWARQNGRDAAARADVQQAIDAQIYRAGRLQERSQEAILRDTIMIDTDGARAGQINGLSVLSLGAHAFGRPSRITARVRMGKGEVVDIERQVEMGGPIHSKGVLILASFLGARYAAERPLSISASLVFEQSYAGVDGDSASSAELYALLSSLAGVPIKQSLAVTGSVNQHGQVQAIGGVNEKIEGFFDICRARGLTGEQGVLIPPANIEHLMLRQDVIDAVADGQFHIYAVSTIDEGIELLTGAPAGEADETGAYPEGSINYLVEKRLQELAEKQRAYQRAQETEQEDAEMGQEE